MNLTCSSASDTDSEGDDVQPPSPFEAPPNDPPLPSQEGPSNKGKAHAEAEEENDEDEEAEEEASEDEDEGDDSDDADDGNDNGDDDGTHVLPLQSFMPNAYLVAFSFVLCACFFVCV